MVSAPAESMELIEALIRQLDQLPAAEAQIKVFTIVNGDATTLVDMLQALFARARRPGRRFNSAGSSPRLGSASGESRWCRCGSPSTRAPTASSPPASTGDLQRRRGDPRCGLDDSDVRHRKSVVYRLKNAPADRRGQRHQRVPPAASGRCRQVAPGPDQPLRADRARSGRRAGAGQQQPDRQRHAAVLRRDQEDRRGARRSGRRW